MTRRTTTRDLDLGIQTALSAEEEELLAQLEADPSLHELIADTFRGRLRFYAVMSWVWTGVLAALMFYCGWRTFQTEGSEQVVWQTATIFCMLGVALLKLFVWMEIHRKSLLRELKRLELRLLERDRPTPAAEEPRS